MDDREKKDLVIKRIKEEKANAERWLGREFAIYLWIDKLTLKINWANNPPLFYREWESPPNNTSFATRTVSVAELLVHPIDYILNRLANDFDIDLW